MPIEAPDGDAFFGVTKFIGPCGQTHSGVLLASREDCMEAVVMGVGLCRDDECTMAEGALYLIRESDGAQRPFFVAQTDCAVFEDGWHFVMEWNEMPDSAGAAA